MTDAVTHFIDETANRDDANSAMWTNQIQTFSHDDVMKFLVQLEDMWKINNRDDIYLSYRIGYENFFTKEELTEDGLPVSIDITRVESKVKRMNERLCELYHRSDTLKHDGYRG